jgi:hypothetical protein
VAALPQVPPSENAAALSGGAPVPVGISAMPFVLGSLPRITRARTSEDGRSVVVTDPHPIFVETATAQRPIEN